MSQVTKSYTSYKKVFSLLSISHFTIKEKIVAKKQITIFLTKFCSDFGNGFLCVFENYQNSLTNYMRHIYKINFTRTGFGVLPHVILTSILFQREENTHRNYCRNHYDSDHFFYFLTRKLPKFLEYK